VHLAVFDTIAGRWEVLPGFSGLEDASGWSVAQYYSIMGVDVVGLKIRVSCAGAPHLAVYDTESRGWEWNPQCAVGGGQPVSEEISLISSMTEVCREDPDYAGYFAAIEAINGTDIVIRRIENENMTRIYEGVKARIAADNGDDANERTLFHGTRMEAALGILESGFDDRYWNGDRGAAFGRGMYFAANPAVSDSLTGRGERLVRWMLVCRVTLGQTETIQPGNPLYFPKPPYHSSTGREAHWFPNEDQFIVYRYGQAIPLLIIRYTR
jgi:hypothetical protein